MRERESRKSARTREETETDRESVCIRHARSERSGLWRATHSVGRGAAAGKTWQVVPAGIAGGGGGK